MGDHDHDVIEYGHADKLPAHIAKISDDHLPRKSVVEPDADSGQGPDKSKIKRHPRFDDKGGN